MSTKHKSKGKMFAEKPVSHISAKPTSKKKGMEKEKEGKIPAPAVPAESSDESSNKSDAYSSGDDSENGGVDDEGMERLMNALGEEGLAEAQRDLEILGGDDDDDEEYEGESVEGEENSDEVGSDSDDSKLEEEGAEEDEENDDGLPLDDLEDVELDADVVPRQKVEIDNEVAMDRILSTIKLDPSLPWTETLVTTYPSSVDVDVNDDLNRELEFYKQALEGVSTSRSLAAKARPPLPFVRPPDFFAEMVKSDAHMARIRQRLLNESASIKKSEDKRKEREGKKFGKQVQIEKLKERDRSRKEMEERVKGLKRKRGDLLQEGRATGGDDDFDVAVEDAISDKPAKRSRTSDPSSRGGRGGARRGLSRDARDKKFGFGTSGRDRRSKQNTKESTDDVLAFHSKGGSFSRRGGSRSGSAKGGRSGAARGGKKRLGKSRRK